MLFAILLAGGRGKRFDAFGTAKQYRVLKNKPLFRHSLDRLLEWGRFSRIVLTISPEKKEEIETELASLPVSIIEGGKERFHSVRNGLDFIKAHFSPGENARVFIHDSARPLLKLPYLDALLDALTHYPAATLGYPLSDALKEADKEGHILRDRDRQGIWAVTTPQAFHFSRLLELYSSHPAVFYDETSLFLQKRLPAKIVEAGRYNLKITYPEDWEAAEKLLS